MSPSMLRLSLHNKVHFTHFLIIVIEQVFCAKSSSATTFSYIAPITFFHSRNICFPALFKYNYKLKYALFKKYSDFLYKIQDSGLSVYAVLLDVRMKSGAKLYIYF